MFYSFLIFLALFLIVWGIIRFVGWFRAWLGRGKPTRRAIEEGLVSENTAQAVDALQAFRDQQKLAKKAGEKPPRLTSEQRRELMAARAVQRDEFLDKLHLSWFHIVMIFFIGSILGLIIEEIWMFITAGLTESRVGLVWGPFSPLYGVGALLMTLATFGMRKKGAKLWLVFLACLVIGGTLEQVTGWAMETLFNASSWDYSEVPGAITQWVAVPFLIFWGVLGTIWYKFIMPELLYWLGTPTTQRQAVFVLLLTLYLGMDIFMTLACFSRQAARDEGIPPQNGFEQYLDDNYSDQFIENRFQNLTIGESDA